MELRHRWSSPRLFGGGGVGSHKSTRSRWPHLGLNWQRTQMRERIKNVDFGGWACEKDLGGVAGGKTINRVYCMKKFN